jgi:integrase
MRRKSNAKLFPGSKSDATKYRDRDSVTAPDGTKRDIQGYGRTKAEATAEFERKAAVFLARHPAAQTITFEQLAAKWLTHKKMQGRKRRTISSYADVLRNHLIPALGETPVARISLQDLQAVQYALVAAGKHRTAEMAVLILKSSYDYAAKLYRGEVDIPNLARDLDAVSKPRTEDPKDGIWTHEQIERFLTTARAEYDALKSLYYPLYLTSIAAGLRRGELLGLRWHSVGSDAAGPYLQIREQITVDNGELYVETPKTPMSNRRVPLPQPIYELLLAHRELLRQVERTVSGYAANDLVFPSFKGTPISPSNLRRSYLAQINKSGSSLAECTGITDRFQKWRAQRTELTYSVHLKHGLEGAAPGARAYLTFWEGGWHVTEHEVQPELPPIYFHNLRKCAATYITQALVDAGRYAPKIVAQILGHARPDVALQIYTKIVNDDLKYATFNPLAGRAPVMERLRGKEKDEKL